ncbi:MAG: hypothetical protein JF616_17980 [Fibrobacteres bacterium]|jgi:hypothetical protein|nr:hypothetical protein [Fibrobacterota bacterium]
MRVPFRIRSAFPAGAALLLAAGLSAAIAGPKSPSPTDSAAIVPAGMHAHMDCMADSAEMGKLRQTVQDALKSGDKAKMKGALEKVDAHFAKMQDMMEQCKAEIKKAGGASMDHEGGMMCGKDHEGGGASKSANHK